MNLTLREGWIALAFHAGICGAFSVPLIGAGHGVAPIGLLMVLAAAEETWAGMVTLGWCAIATLAVAAFLPWRIPHAVLTAVGLVALVCAWVQFVSMSEVIPITVVLSVPFLAGCVGRIVHLALQARKDGGPLRRGPSTEPPVA